MFFQFQSSREFSKAVIWKLITGGLFFLGLGALMIAAPLLVVFPLACLCFLGAFGLFGAAWRAFWALRAMDRGAGPAGTRNDYEDASFKEIQ